MSTEQEPTKQLTLNDPIDPVTLKRFDELQTLRVQLADKYLDLEQEKIRVMRAASNLDVERQRLFEAVLVARGLSPTHPVEIDAKTGTIKLLAPLSAPEAPTAPATNGVEMASSTPA